MKEELCRIFCDSISVREVPVGLAVSTVFDGLRGEPLGFYIVGPDELGRYYVQDDGRTVPFLEASGADLSSDTRRESMAELLKEYGARYDQDSFELRTDGVSAEEMPAVAMKFVAMLMRVQDLLFMTQERVASTFKEDVVSRLSTVLPKQATIVEAQPVSPKLAGYEADLVVRSEGYDPVAIFLATRDGKLQEAIILQLIAQYEAHVDCKVIALIEDDGSVSPKMRQRADNRLDAVPVFRGDEDAAIAKIQKLAMGESPRILH